MTSISDRMSDISPFYVMQLLARAKELDSLGKRVVHMEIGEPDFPTPDAVVEAGIRFIRDGGVKYTPAAGLTELREAISRHYSTRYGIAVPRSRIFVTPGGSGALLLALGVLLNPGQEVLLADPGYPCNRNFIRLFEGKSKLLCVGPATGYQLTAEAIRTNWNDGTAGVLIASPSNPTGTVIAGGQFASIVEVVRENDGFVISDEIYHGLEYGVRSDTALKFDDNCFVVNSFSKYFGMTGWRIGWVVVPEPFVEAIERLAQNIFISAPAHSQYAALASLENTCILELERRRLEFENRRDFLFDNLRRLGFLVSAKPQGAFYIYADCSVHTDDSYRFARDLLERAGVAVTPGKDFGHNAAETHLRFAYTTSMDQLQEGIARLEKVVGR